MEQWKRWSPHPDVQKKLYLTKILLNDNTILIYGKLMPKKDEDIMKYIKFEYNNSLLAFRNSDEATQLMTYDYLDANYDDDFYAEWDLFIIEKSNYTKWFLDECLDPELNLEIEHHVFFTDEVVDILCTKKPLITVSDTPMYGLL